MIWGECTSHRLESLTTWTAPGSWFMNSALQHTQTSTNGMCEVPTVASFQTRETVQRIQTVL